MTLLNSHYLPNAFQSSEIALRITGLTPEVGLFLANGFDGLNLWENGNENEADSVDWTDKCSWTLEWEVQMSDVGPWGIIVNSLISVEWKVILAILGPFFFNVCKKSKTSRNSKLVRVPTCLAVENRDSSDGYRERKDELTFPQDWKIKVPTQTDFELG